ncbi:MAG: hypothetical protein IJU03_09265 [Thermoguttaceae bacterium]|nr:hypothetical protein [Thermoguttaceae bacterium]
MTSLSRAALRFSLVAAVSVVVLTLSSVPRLNAQDYDYDDMGIHPGPYQAYPSGTVPAVGRNDPDFTDEQYGMFEEFLDVPDGKDAKFYQGRLEALAACKTRLDERRYRHRAAQLMERVDAAYERADALFLATVAEEQREIYRRFNELVRQGNPDALLAFIQEYDGPNFEWRPVPRSFVAQMYEAYYRMRIQQAALAGNSDALRATIDEIIKTENPLVSSCAPNLVETVALYDRNLAALFVSRASDVYGARRQISMGVSGVPLLIGSNSDKRFHREPLIAVDSPGRKAAIKFFTVPDGGDLEFYRQELERVSQNPPIPFGGDVSSLDVEKMRDQARENALRHIVLLTVHSDGGVNEDELNKYKELIFQDNNNNYRAALELQELGLLSQEQYSFDMRRLETARRRYSNQLFSGLAEVDAVTRREKVKEIVEEAKTNPDVIDAYRQNERYLEETSPEFAAELRAAIYESGQNLKDLRIVDAVRDMAPYPDPASFIGKTIDVRGLDVNLKDFSSKGKPTVLMISTSSGSLYNELDRLCYSKRREAVERGDVALVGYLIPRRSAEPGFNQIDDIKIDFGDDLARFRAAPWTTLSERAARAAKERDGADYPLLGDEIKIKYLCCFFLDADGKIVDGYDLQQLRFGDFWKLEQRFNNLIPKGTER